MIKAIAVLPDQTNYKLKTMSINPIRQHQALTRSRRKRKNKVKVSLSLIVSFNWQIRRQEGTPGSKKLRNLYKFFFNLRSTIKDFALCIKNA